MLKPRLLNRQKVQKGLLMVLSVSFHFLKWLATATGPDADCPVYESKRLIADVRLGKIGAIPANNRT